ncbi:hypothetical protein FACS1894159_06140 [Bacteroidia bacterium]|nr:hypothetical protein FACS1894159_06140 [Bacteroidia bacterium]
MRFNLKTRIFRAVLYLGAMTHLRHFRGHGIHSPYAYNLVRNTIYKRHVVGSDHSLFEAMRSMKMPRRSSVQIQNIMHHLHCTSWRIVSGVGDMAGLGAETLVLTHPDIDKEGLLKVFRCVKQGGGSMIVIFPRSNSYRHAICRRLCRKGEFMSIDNRRFTLMQFSPKLPRQHYKL